MSFQEIPCKKCGSPFQENHHKHMTGSGMYHTSCYNDSGFKVNPGRKEIRSQELLESFVLYCSRNPDQRFWQALRNWCGWSFIWVSKNPLSEDLSYMNIQDTFYWEKMKHHESKRNRGY